MYHAILVGSAVILLSATLSAQKINVDESKVPQYELPDPLLAADGTRIETATQWETKRRSEILQLFKDHVYGSMPVPPDRSHRLKATVTKEAVIEILVDPSGESNETVKAKLKEVQIRLDNSEVNNENDEPKLVANLLIFLPVDQTSPVPIFLGYNGGDNTTVHPSKEITAHPFWNRDQQKMQMPDDSARGAGAPSWPVGLIVERGFGLATLYNGDIDPDFDDGFKNGVHALYPQLQGRADNWSTLGAWAWGLHRVLDYFESDPEISSEHVAVFGHSRLGKTALWAGATDPRFAMVISNNSGCGGAALARRKFGETVERMNRVFPHWNCQKNREYNDNENSLPVDQHMLISLIAPRPVYIASAVEDTWADPQGEFLSAFHAGPVYQLFGETGLGLATPEMPDLNMPVGETVRYHIRSGRHDITLYDWQQYLDFADRFLK